MPGRPSKYDKAYNEQVIKLCKLGATDKELANFFNVSESTLNLWKLKHKAFSESLNKGKLEADAIIADSLFNRAKGYEHMEDKIFNNNGEEMVVPTMKHYPPDTTACIFWLKNRQKDHWRDQREVTGNINHVHKHEGLQDADTRIREILGQGEAASNPAPKPH